ncbi:RNA polymerase sigma factor [Pseudonocardia sp. DLS-67]
MATSSDVEDLLRELAPQALGSVVRRYGDFARAEDALQEALLAALEVWTRDGVPEHPAGWLRTVALRRYVDQLRTDAARSRREAALVDATPRDALVTPPPDAEPVRDDLLELLFLCCHPALGPSAQVALTLRAVGGLTTAEIAAAFLVPEPTMAQRIVRAKQRLRDAGARFAPLSGPELDARLAAVLHVLYLMFNEGYAATSGPALRRVELTGHAVRLTRRLHERTPEAGEVAGLLALMLLTEARGPGRTGADGELVPLAEQDRAAWDRSAVAEGTELITRTLATAPIGPYQVQAAIAAVHAEAPSAADTDWQQVLALYDLLEKLAPNPVVTLNRAVALGEVRGPRAALDLLAELDDGPLAAHHRLAAVRAHLLERNGDRDAAAHAWREAARLAGSLPERRYLVRRAADLA